MKLISISKTKSPIRLVTFLLVVFVSLLLFFLAVVACGVKEPDREVVRETVIAQVPATVVVTQTLNVEVDVTRVVEVPVTVVSTPTRKPAINSSPTPYYFEPYPYATLIEISEVDAIIREILTKDSLALRERIIFQKSTCVHPSDPWESPCTEDEEIGTQIEVFRYAYCEGFETRDEETITGVLEDLIATTTGLYAIYSGNNEYFHTNREGESYVIIFTSIYNTEANIVFVEAAGLSGINFGCSTSPEEALEMFGDYAILPPISRLQN